MFKFSKYKLSLIWNLLILFHVNFVFINHNWSAVEYTETGHLNWEWNGYLLYIKIISYFQSTQCVKRIMWKRYTSTCETASFQSLMAYQMSTFSKVQFGQLGRSLTKMWISQQSWTLQVCFTQIYPDSQTI